MEIKIKKLNKNRWKDYRDLRLEALKKELIAFGSSYNEEKNLSEEEWKKKIKNVLFALSKDKLIGMIVCIRENKIKTKHIANIFGVYITREYRGQEVGKKLIDSAIARIRKSKDVLKIKLTVNPKQKAALKLYQNCGFKIVGKMKKELYIGGRFYDGLMMEKIL